jgi:hypothetical protein
MKKLILSKYFLAGSIVLIFSHGCSWNYTTVERTVNAVWSADDSQVFKIISIYETTKPSEKYYYAPAGKNWQYRFETCNPDLSVCKVVGNSDDIDQGGLLQYSPVYWLPDVQKMAFLNPSKRALLKNLSGQEIPLHPPPDIIDKIFVNTKNIQDAIDLAPSPGEDVVAVYFQATYLTSGNFTDFTYHQCISFFDSGTGNHIFTQEIPFNKTNPALNVIRQFNNERCQFLWSKNGTGVFVISRNKAYFIKYTSPSGISEVDLVPERGTKTNSGIISNSGQQLLVKADGNNTSLEIIKLEDWKPFGSLGLIPKETNTYSFW